ncbi:MAG: gephyrin-like molybdotransferase Glp [Planctomycetales bacterium]
MENDHDMTPPPSTRRDSDVRMRGFASRALVAEALAWVDAQAQPLEREIALLDAACGRVLAAELVAGIDVPGFDRAAMDGYALRAAETTGAGEYNPLAFRLVGESLPGRPFDRDVDPGEAVRIMTGAPLPNGTDAVVPAEYASERSSTVDHHSSSITPRLSTFNPRPSSSVEITAPVSPGKHVGRRGEDIAAGARLLAAGRRLRPQDIGLAASVGLDRLEVVRPPRVRLLATGNELAVPGGPRGPHEIYDSNTSMLAALVERDGGGVVERLRVEDSRDAVRAALLAAGADVVLVSGGSSVGAEDHAPSLVAELGKLAIHGVAMRPSSPTGMGRLGEALVFLLPGNPVSCLCAYDFFAGRAIRRMGGRSADWPYPRIEAEVGRKIVSAIGRVDYCRVALREGKVEPLAVAGASILSSTTRADGFVIVPEEREGHAPGSRVTVLLYDAGL